MANDRKGPKKAKAENVIVRAPRPKPPPESDDAWELDGLGEEPIRSKAEIKAVEAEVAAIGGEGRGWKIAASMVNRFRPVPHFMWPIVHSVFGKPGALGEPDPMTFSNVAPLIVRCAQDRTLAQLPPRADSEERNLGQSIKLIGADVAAAACLIHAVCRRVSTVVNERVSRPILDDALLRTHIGFYVGLFAPEIGAGRGMLAGFAGRCGLAVQIAAGEIDQAQRALAGMASGQDMSQVCSHVYGCDPLEVAALALISGGCCRDIAFGISSYSARKKDVAPGTEQYRWLALFSIVEHTRMGAQNLILPEYWTALGYDQGKQLELSDEVLSSQRRGHGWGWLTSPQIAAAGQMAEPIKDPSEIRRNRT